jgi:large subunit ribosomal protein L31
MKQAIHPDLKTAKVVCTGCGNEFETLSTRANIQVSICNECHPFFTGTNKIVDAEGRIDKFRSRQAKTKAKNTAN